MSKVVIDDLRDTASASARYASMTPSLIAADAQDVTLIRVIAAVFAVVTGGADVLAYLVAWAIIPEDGETASVPDPRRRRPQRLTRRTIT
jgi:PspC domain